VDRDHTIEARFTQTTTYDVLIDVEMDNQIGSNKLSLGFQLDHESAWGLSTSTRRNLASDANFGIVRIFSHKVEPCTYWDDSSRTGNFDWSEVDEIVRDIFQTGAEPLICIGFWDWTFDRILAPQGMSSTATGLPDPDNYAAYATEWVEHFDEIGLSVKYYQIINEPAHYFGWNSRDTSKLENYVELWNAAARSMRDVNSRIKLSQDHITIRWVFDYWLVHGEDIDYIDIHKYDSDTIGKYDVSEMLDRAETYKFNSDSTFYGIDTVRQKWLSNRGKSIPLIISESNYNSAWETGTDPEIQKMTGTVWLALLLRRAVQLETEFYIYYSWMSSASTRRENGLGYGMINSDNDQPWYPYLLCEVIGNNLNRGDTIVESSSSSNDMRTLAWIKNGKTYLLIINKSSQQKEIYISGINNQMNYQMLNNQISYLNPEIQEGTINTSETFTLNGYSVILCKTS